jgi:hypothetical protein
MRFDGRIGRMPNPLDALFPSNDRIARGKAGDPPLPYPGDMVTVARRFNSLEAELLRGRLEADGIPATLGDPHTVQTDSLLTVALGGVRIRVPTEYEQQALRAIADVEGGAFALEEGADVAGTPAAPDAPDTPDPDQATVFSLARDVGLPLVVLAAVCVFVFAAVIVAFMH